MARGKISYEHSHYGEEPVIAKNSTSLEMIHAYNWYGHYFMADDAKKFALEYLRISKKYNSEFVKIVAEITSVDLYNIGWNCRILSMGGELPVDIEKKTFSELETLVDTQKTKTEIDDDVIKPILSLQERVSAYASDRIADLEDQIDIFLRNKNEDFNALSWFAKMNIKPQVAAIISNYYSPLYDQLFIACKNTDPQLKEAYASWKKKDLKKYTDFIKDILGASEMQKNVVKAPRKQRKKKIKPASVLVAKMKHAKEYKELNLTSIRAEEIINSTQLWIYNTKTRNLTVFNSISGTGLSVKGTTIIGFDTNTSMTKKLRKPAVQLIGVIRGGKVVLKQLMSMIKSKPSVTRGRINKDVILVRSIK